MRTHGACGLALLLAANVALSQDAGDDSWHFLVAPYLWVAAIDGEAGAKGTASNIHLSFDDIVQNLDMGFMGQFEAHKNRLGFVVNPVYLNLSAKEKGPLSFIDVRPGLEAEIVEAFATWELTPGFELLAGARYTNVDVKIRLHDNNTGVTRSQEGKQNWTDPLLGARYEHSFDDDWSIGLRGDVGGSDRKTNFAWNALATVGYKVGSSGKVYFGYRLLDYNYEDGDAANRFTFNIRVDGPLLGYGMTF
jgi:opacity protein-like surface antigen